MSSAGKCLKCGGKVVNTSHGEYCPKETCKWGWETEMDGSPLRAPMTSAYKDLLKLQEKLLSDYMKYFLGPYNATGLTRAETQQMCSDALTPILAKLAQERQEGPTPEEMRVCEINWLFLHPDELYIFTVDESCEACRAYRDHKPDPRSAADKPAGTPTDGRESVDELREQVNLLQEAISPGRIAEIDYYVKVAGRMREAELNAGRVIKPKEIDFGTSEEVISGLDRINAHNIEIREDQCPHGYVHGDCGKCAPLAGQEASTPSARVEPDAPTSDIEITDELRATLEKAIEESRSNANEPYRYEESDQPAQNVTKFFGRIMQGTSFVARIGTKHAQEYVDFLNGKLVPSDREKQIRAEALKEAAKHCETMQRGPSVSPAMWRVVKKVLQSTAAGIRSRALAESPTTITDREKQFEEALHALLQELDMLEAKRMSPKPRLMSLDKMRALAPARLAESPRETPR